MRQGCGGVAEAMVGPCTEGVEGATQLIILLGCQDGTRPIVIVRHNMHMRHPCCAHGAVVHGTQAASSSFQQPLSHGLHVVDRRIWAWVASTFGAVQFQTSARTRVPPSELARRKCRSRRTLEEQRQIQQRSAQNAAVCVPGPHSAQAFGRLTQTLQPRCRRRMPC